MQQTSSFEKMNSLVSIIMPTHNSAKFLGKTVDSVIQQNYENWELLITDDKSSDNTIEVLKEIANNDKRISYQQLEKNSGPGISRNNSLRLAKGRFVAFLDSDDHWSPEKLSTQLEFMIENDYALTFTSYNLYDEAGQALEGNVRAKPVVDISDMLKSNYLTCSTVIFDKEKVGEVYMPEIRKRQDYGLWFEIIKKTGAAYGLDKKLCNYTIRKNSVSSNKLKVIAYQWKFFRGVLGLTFISSCRSMYYSILYSLTGKRNRGV